MRRIWLGLLLALVLMGEAFAQGAALPAGYLSTSGNQIVSGSTDVRIAGVGYGNPGTAGSYSADMALLRAAGFNAVRIDYWDETLCPGGTCNLTTFDAYVSAATSNNMKVIFDHHGNEGNNNACLSQQENGLWYDVNSATVIGGVAWNTLTSNTDGCVTGNVTYAQFKANWVAIATHYAGNSTVIGMDLDNEPLIGGSCSSNCQATTVNWGGNNGSDVRLMCNDTGTAVETADPGVLIICEGPVNFSGTFLDSVAMPGGANGIMDLTGVTAHPVSVGVSGKVVYSVHDYPNDISGSSPDSGSTAITFKNDAWGFVFTTGAAPLYIGEMAADLDGSAGSNLTDEQAWASTLVSYINGTAAGGPTISGTQQGISNNWHTYGYVTGQVPDGICASSLCATFRTGQEAEWSQIQYVASGSEGFSINTIGSQNINTAFGVSGNVIGYGSAPTMQYQNNGGTWTAFPGGSSVSTSSFSFTDPGIAAATTTATVGVRDASITTNNATSNTFTVSASSTGPAGISTPANLTAYFNSIVGKGVVSGQFTGSNNQGAPYGGIGPINTIQSISGKYLGMIGCDLVDYPTNVFDNSCSTYAIPYWQAGGLITTIISMPNPTNNTNPNDLSLSAGDILTPGTTTNTNFVNYLNTIASYLQVYQTAGVVVAIRPFQESNGNWFWWGTEGGGSGLTPTQFIAMWQYMHNYLVNTKGLTNLWWVYSVNAGTGSDTANYPGSAYVDGVGYDVYIDTPGSCCTADYSTLSSYGKPIWMSEFGPGGPSAGDLSFAETTLISQLQTYTPNVVAFQQWWSANSGAGWGMDTLTNTAAVSSALNNSYVINRGNINCTTCTGGGGGGGGTTTTTWNPADLAGTITLSNSNLTATSTSAAAGGVRSTTSYSSGSYCEQVTASTLTANWNVGLANSSFALAGGGTLGIDANDLGFYPNGNNPQAVYYNATQLTVGTGADVSGDPVTMCENFTTSEYWVSTPVMRSAGQTWNNSTTANPATGVGGVSFAGLACPCFIAFNTLDTGSAAILNPTGPFAVVLPAGFAYWQPNASANYSIITTVGPSVVDTLGESFAINASGQVTVNGTADTSINNVVLLAWVNGSVWYKNSSGLWFSKTQASNPWAPTNGTALGPLNHPISFTLTP